MSTPNLSEFSKDELQVLLNVVVAEIVDEDNHRKEWLKYFGGIGGYYEAQEERLKKYKTLCLWRVQLLNAIGKVGMMDLAKYN